MCILFLAVEQHPQYPLIVAANRDEFHVRPSRALHQWQDAPGIIAGRDLQAHGSWLGLHKAGRFAALTNIRRPDLMRDAAPSRGDLVVQALQTADSAAYGRFLMAGTAHNPFNLVFGDMQRLYLFSSVNRELSVLGSGFHAISNGLPDAAWPKMQRGVQLLQRAVADSQLDDAALLAMMRDDASASDEQLPDTGVGIATERLLAPIYIKDARYGTRTTSLLFLNPQSYRFVEQNYHADGSDAGATCLAGEFG